jgi:hypothetical protein
MSQCGESSKFHSLTDFIFSTKFVTEPKTAAPVSSGVTALKA